MPPIVSWSKFRGEQFMGFDLLTFDRKFTSEIK